MVQFINIILKLNITAAFCFVFVMFARLILQKAPKKYSYFLWLIVFVRLLVPIVVDSSFGLIPSRLKLSENPIVYTTQTQNTTSDTTPSVNLESHTAVSGDLSMTNPSAGHMSTDQTDETFADQTLNQIQSSTPASSADTYFVQNSFTNTIHKGNLIIYILFFSWITGFFIFCFVTIMKNYTFKKRLYSADTTESDYTVDNQIYHVRITNAYDSPFVYGIIRPVIYLPETLTEKEYSYILTHEQIHIKRHDYLIKFCAYLCCMLYWFNPVVWLSYHFMCKDMEMSCDEAVLQKLGSEIKKEYASSLLAASIQPKRLSFIPPAFGENDVKSRIQNVLKYKKTKLILSISAVVLIIVICIISLPNAGKKQTDGTTIDSSLETTTPDDSSQDPGNMDTDLDSALPESNTSDEIITLPLSSSAYDPETPGDTDTPADTEVINDTIRTSVSNPTHIQTHYWDIQLPEN